MIVGEMVSEHTRSCGRIFVLVDEERDCLESKIKCVCKKNASPRINIFYYRKFLDLKGIKGILYRP